MNVAKKMVKIFFLGIENVRNSGFKGIKIANKKAARYNTIENAKSTGNPKFSMIKPPTAGAVMPATDGIAAE